MIEPNSYYLTVGGHTAYVDKLAPNGRYIGWVIDHYFHGDEKVENYWTEQGESIGKAWDLKLYSKSNSEQDLDRWRVP